MPYSATTPARLADEINDVLGIGGEPLDEFTLNRYYHKLRTLRDEGKFTLSDYQAYSKVLYQMGRVEEAFATNREALHLHNDFSVLSIDAIEKIDLWQVGRYDFDPESDFFGHRANPERRSLRYSFGGSEILLGDGSIAWTIPCERRFTGNVDVHPETGYRVTLGPYEIEQDFEDALEVRFAVHHLVILPVIESWLTGRLSDDERHYVEDRLGHSGRNAVDAHVIVRAAGPANVQVRLWPIARGRWVGIAPDLSLPAFGTTEHEAVQSVENAVRHMREVPEPATS